MGKLVVGLLASLRRAPTLQKLEWAGILAPIAFLVLYNYLIVSPAHSLLHSSWGIVVLAIALGAAVAAFSRSVFRTIGRLQKNVQELSTVSANQNAQLRALNEANLALSSERLLSSVLQRVVDLSRDLAQARYAALSVLGDGQEIRVFLTSGIDAEARQRIGSLPVGKGLLGLMLERADPMRLDNMAGHPASVGFPEGHPQMTTFLGVPIRYQGRIVGSLYLSEKTGGGLFTDEDEEIVRLFANQAAVAIHNVQLDEQVQALAVETERTRISREMHDGLAQVLSYVNTKAQAAEAFLSKGDVASGEEQLRELSQAARQVYGDVREGILALRTQIGSDRKLREVLEEYIVEFEHQLGHPVTLRWQTEPDILELSPLQEVQILRIVQEALTNVRKHSDAAEVKVSFSEQDRQLEIEVSDDGRGFNPLAIERGRWPHLGLQTMQERAEAIGGVFEIRSAPSKGTTVTIRLPKEARDKL